VCFDLASPLIFLGIFTLIPSTLVIVVVAEVAEEVLEME
jgi:hypothetical protein